MQLAVETQAAIGVLYQLRMECGIAWSRRMALRAGKPINHSKPFATTQQLEGLSWYSGNEPMRASFQKLAGMLKDELQVVANWKEFVSLLKDKNLPISEPEAKELLRFAINLSAEKLIDPFQAEQSSEEVFDLYQLGLETGVLFSGGRLANQHYINLCQLALRLNRLDLAAQWTEAFAQLLMAPAEEEKSVFLNRARIAIFREDYQLARTQIMQYHPKQLRKRAAYVIEIKALAHIDPIEAEARIDAFRHWMRTDFPSHKQDRMEIEHQRALLIGRILRTPANARARRKQLQKAIAAFPLDQKWLMDLFNAQVM